MADMLRRSFRTVSGFFTFELAPGIAPAQIIVLAIMFVTTRFAIDFINLMQPFILSVQLKVPATEMGRLTGFLGAIQQTVLLLTIGFAGALADRYGRKPMMLVALAGMGLLCFAFPFVAGVALLVVLRMILGLVTSAYTAGGVPLIHDFPADNSRGRFLSFVIIVQLVSSVVFVGLIGSRLPHWLIRYGMSPLTAGLVSFILFGMIAMGGLWVTWARFRDPPRQHPVEPAGAAIGSLLIRLRDVIAYGRENPKFGILIILSFVTRADTAIITSFLTLWVVNAGGAIGIPTATAMATAGTLLIIYNISSFVMPPLFGALADRWDRMPMLLFSLALGGVAFMAPMLVSDPFGWKAIAIIILIGVAEGAQTVSSQAMFGQEAPAHLRGSAFGLFTIFGSLSVIAVTAVGGLLYDKLGYGAPFALVGILNFLFLAIIAVMLSKSKSR